MKKILYYDCFSGISGDMNLGAMLDLGVAPDVLIGELKKLALPGWDLAVKNDLRRGIRGTKVDVVIDRPADGRGHAPAHHRSLREIETLIDDSDLSTVVKKTSVGIFRLIARSEATVHGQAVQDIHFHEVGAVDSIVDIVGAAVCFDHLKADLVLASPVELGGGFVKCAHGTLPVPAPATVEILRNIPVKSGAVPFETTTPTGAAILAWAVHEFTGRPELIIEKIGYGIGNRDTDLPNVLRVYLARMEGEDENGCAGEEAVMIECNIDDMSPENYEFIMDRLFAVGAADVFLTPVIMKKSRPAVVLSVLCGHPVKETVKDTLFLNTSSIGLREYGVRKSLLKRDFTEITTEYGTVTVKNAYYKGRRIHAKPESRDCRRLADERQVTLLEIYRAVQNRLSAGP